MGQRWGELFKTKCIFVKNHAMALLKHLPNTITCLNLFCGCLAVLSAFRGHLEVAAWLILAAGVFDFLDGMAARLFNAYSELGKQLDSLADVVSFGVAPSAILFALAENSLIAQYPDFAWESAPATQKILLFAVFSVAVFSALRLAKFNIDTRQSSSFLGLPTPANAFFLLSLVFWVQPETGTIPGISAWIYPATALLFSALLVSEIPMFSLKVKSLAWRENRVRYLFLGLSLPLAAYFGMRSLTLIMLLYILLSIASSVKKPA